MNYNLLFASAALGLSGCIGSSEPRNPMTKLVIVAPVVGATTAPVDSPSGDEPLDSNPQPKQDGSKFY